MIINSFSIAPTPLVYFGRGKINLLPGLIKAFGKNILLVTGKSSFTSTIQFANLLEALRKESISFHHAIVDQEPSPAIIDSMVAEFRMSGLEVVVAIGGGSVLDGGKAISAMLTQQGSVEDYLEGVGVLAPCGSKIPFIAIPTTAGTGSEATKNAVISQIGIKGFKKSLRHNNYVPNIAIIDPDLALSCPASITAYSGMDAFTQLLESYLSTASNPVTDSLALGALRIVKASLPLAVSEGSNPDGRSGMAYAALISGITLANAGLGVVHGFASSIGGLFDVPHGLICGSLMCSANRVTVAKLRQSKDSEWALARYATVGRIFSKEEGKSEAFYVDALLDAIYFYTDLFALPKLSTWGVKKENIADILLHTENKNNPIALTPSELEEIISERT